MNKKLLASVVKKTISPPMDLLSGIPQRSGRQAILGPYQDIFVRVFLFSDGTEKFPVICFDLGMAPGQARLRRRLERDYNIQPLAVVFGCTHNHQMQIIDVDGEGPMGAAENDPATERLMDYIEDIVADAVGEATESLRPARIGIASGNSYINVSRDWPTPAGALQNSNFHGYSDKELTVLRVESTDGELLGLLANYGMHGNMLFGLLVNGTFPYYGGDLPGAISEYVEKATGAVCGWTIGAAGDQNPIVTSFLGDPVPDDGGHFAVAQKTLDKDSCLALMGHLAAVQGLDILNISSRITSFSDTFDFRYGEALRKVPERTQYRQQYQAFALSVGIKPEPQATGHEIEYHFQLASLNGIGFAGMNCEAYAKLGRIVKDVLPYEHTFVLEMQFNHIGYIPDVRTEDICGFGTMASPALSPWDTERTFYECFRNLAETLGSRPF